MEQQMRCQRNPNDYFCQEPYLRPGLWKDDEVSERRPWWKVADNGIGIGGHFAVDAGMIYIGGH